MKDYTLEELSKDESEAVTKELQEVLKKYNCEMGVTSTINILKRVETGVPSPFIEPTDGEKDNIEEKKTD